MLLSIIRHNFKVSAEKIECVLFSCVFIVKTKKIAIVRSNLFSSLSKSRLSLASAYTIHFSYFFVVFVECYELFSLNSSHFTKASDLREQYNFLHNSSDKFYESLLCKLTYETFLFYKMFKVKIILVSNDLNIVKHRDCLAAAVEIFCFISEKSRISSHFLDLLRKPSKNRSKKVLILVSVSRISWSFKNFEPQPL